MKITEALIEKIHALLDAGLVSGLGSPVPGEMCVEAAINYALDRPHGDDPGCVMEPLRQLKILLNDSPRWSSNKARAEGLRRLAIAQLGSKDAVDDKEFTKRVARMTIQTVVPSALRSAARRLSGEHSTKLLSLADKCESEPTEANAREARDAAYAADAYAAYAAAAAYDAAAAAADDAAAAAADAAASASAAAYAAAAAAAAAYASASAYAAASAAAAAAASASAAAYAAEDVLVQFAENIVQILIDMKAPGTKWLKVAA